MKYRRDLSAMSVFSSERRFHAPSAQLEGTHREWMSWGTTRTRQRNARIYLLRCSWLLRVLKPSLYDPPRSPLVLWAFTRETFACVFEPVLRVEQRASRSQWESVVDTPLSALPPFISLPLFVEVFLWVISVAYGRFQFSFVHPATSEVRWARYGKGCLKIHRGFEFRDIYAINCCQWNKKNIVTPDNAGLLKMERCAKEKTIFN